MAMMQVWIVWGQEPVAVFSSEERAKDYIRSHGAGLDWHYRPVGLNPEGLGKLHTGRAARKQWAGAEPKSLAH